MTGKSAEKGAISGNKPKETRLVTGTLIAFQKRNFIYQR